MGILRHSAESFNGYVSEVSNSLKFRYLGLGFLWAWIYTTWFTPVLFPFSEGLTVNNDGSWFVSSAVVAVTLFAMPLMLGDREISSLPVIPVIAGPLTTAGAVLMALEPLFGVALPWLALVGAVLTGIASGWLWMLWGEFTGKVEQEVAELFVPLCVVVPLVVIFISMFVQGPVAGLAICLLPVVSGIFLLLSLNDRDVIRPVALLPADQRPRYTRDFVRVGVGSMALFACFGFAWGTYDYGSMIGWGNSHLGFYEVGALAAVVVAVLYISYTSHPDLFSLYRGLVPVALFGLVFLTVKAPWARSLSFALITCAQYIFDIIIWIYFSRVVRRGICSGGVAIGINRGFIQIGVVLGNLLALSVPQLVARGHMPFSFVAFFLSVVTTTIVLMVLSRTDELERITVKTGPASAVEPTVVDYDTVCDSLSQTFGLTGREREILGYLARGRSLPYIRDALVLSKNTVGTHVRNLYKKLDVHSKQELLDLVEQASSKEPPPR